VIVQCHRDSNDRTKKTDHRDCPEDRPGESIFGIGFGGGNFGMTSEFGVQVARRMATADRLEMRC
jgi:hypothetical protein